MKKILLAFGAMLYFLSASATIKDTSITIGVVPGCTQVLDANQFLPDHSGIHHWNGAKTPSKSQIEISAEIKVQRDSIVFVNADTLRIEFLIQQVDYSIVSQPVVLLHNRDSLVIGFASDYQRLAGDSIQYSTSSQFTTSVSLPVTYKNKYCQAIILKPTFGQLYYFRVKNACGVLSKVTAYNSIRLKKFRKQDTLSTTLELPFNLPAYDLIEVFVDSAQSPFKAVSQLKTATRTVTADKVINVSDFNAIYDTVRTVRNATIQYRVRLKTGGYLLSDTAVYWIYKLAYSQGYPLKAHPYTVTLTNKSDNIQEPIEWTLNGAKYINGSGKNDNEVTLEYATPGSYDVVLSGLYKDVDETADILVDKQVINVPGIFTRGKNDTIFVCDGQPVTLDGYEIMKWSKTNDFAQSINQTRISFTPTESSWYFAHIMDSYTMDEFSDSVFIKVVKPLVLPISFKTDTVCVWTATAKLNLAGIDSLWIEENGSFGKAYSATNLLLLDNSREAFVRYAIDGCYWSGSANLIKSVIDTVANLHLDTLKICDGTKQLVHALPAPKYCIWTLDGAIISTKDTARLSKKGIYTLEYGTVDNRCTIKKNFSINYYKVRRDSISSINYLPGIGYFSTYTSKTGPDSQNALTKIIKRSYKENADTLFNQFEMSSFGFSKTQLLTDSLQYRDKNYSVPLKYVVSNSSMMYGYQCPSSVSIDTSGSPFTLMVGINTSTGTNGLNWTSYTVGKVDSIFIFKGKTPETMKIWRTINASANGVVDSDKDLDYLYAVGVEDTYGASDLYGTLQYPWQKGFITSNISPMEDGFKRIGIVAAYQKATVNRSIYVRAIAPYVDSVYWKIEKEDSTYESLIGSEVSVYRTVARSYDVQLTVKRKDGKFETVVYPDYLTFIEQPYHFTLDSLTVHAGDTVAFRANDYVVSDVIPDYKSSSYLVSAVVDTLKGINHKTAYFSEFIMDTLVFSKTIVDGTIYKLPVQMQNAVDTVVVTVKNNPNKAPRFAAVIPDQVADGGWKFAAFNCNLYVSDDYTLPVNLKYEVLQNSVLSGSITAGVLKVRQVDLDWSGTTTVLIKVTDANGAYDTLRVTYIQPTLMKLASKRPKASFFANKTMIMLTDSVKFSAQLSGADSVQWTFEDGYPATSKEINPTVFFTTPGKHTVSIKATNYHGDTTVTKLQYILVRSTITPRDTTVCANSKLTFSVSNDFKEYKWNTGETTNSIAVSPAKSTTIRVTLYINKIVKVYDSVRVTIPTPANLGKDTAFCEGSRVVLNPGKFKQYFWNGSNDVGGADFIAIQSATYTVKTIDSLKCETFDTVKVTVNPLPKFDLGADTTFCDGVTKSVRVSFMKATYLWSTKSTEDSLRISTSGTWWLRVTDSLGCVASDTIKTTVRIPYVEQIGIVTLSEAEYGVPAMRRNVIAWKPTPDKDIQKYYVYRETTSSKKLVDSVMLGDSTVAIDTTISTYLEASKYYLQTVNGCGSKSELSDPHTTIFLTSTIRRGSIDSVVRVSWTQYKGVDVDEYIVFRARKGGKLDPIKTIKNTGEAQMVWNDSAAFGLNSVYQIGFKFPEFSVDKLKSDTGPFSQSMSNMSEASLVEAPEVEALQVFKVYPNPSKGSFAVRINKSTARNAQIRVEDLLGHAVTVQAVVADGDISVAMPTEAKGLYVVKLISDGETASVLVEVQ